MASRISHSEPRAAGPSRQLVMMGGLLGLVPATGLAVLRMANSHPLGWEEVPGNTVFGVVYSLPYILALITSRLPQAAAQAPLLLSVTLLSFLASFSAFSGVSLVVQHHSIEG